MELFSTLACLLSVIFHSVTLSGCQDGGDHVLPFQPLPPSQHDIAETIHWRCHLINLEPIYLHELFAHPGMEILHMHGNQLDILSSSLSREDLRSLSLHPCYHVTNIGDLVSMEMEWNWDSLQDYVDLDKDWGSLKGADGKVADRGVHRVSRRTVALDRASSHLPYHFNHYLNYSAMVDWYETMASQHPSTVTLVPSIGKTHYGRKIMALHFTDNSPHVVAGSVENRPVVYIQCLLHAREWITGPVCMYIANMLTNTGNQLLRQVEVVMVPIANPDGYAVTWYNYPRYRLWRKNVEPLEGTNCAGVDLNRNFDSHWNGNSLRKSDNPCSILYRGQASGSALEVRALTSYISSLAPRIVGALDIHSYQQKMLYPPAWDDANPNDIDEIRRVAESMAASATKMGVEYTAERMFDIYSATGTFVDWLLDHRGSANNCPSLIPLTVELRPSALQLSHPGFLLPQSQILATCVEISAAFKDFTEKVLGTGQKCFQT